jgi:hypothetical protein
MKRIACALLLGLAACALQAATGTNAPVTLTATESITATNLVRVTQARGRDPAARPGTRMTVTAPVERHTLTFDWRGKTRTVTDDVLTGTPATNYWTNSFGPMFMRTNPPPVRSAPLPVRPPAHP